MVRSGTNLWGQLEIRLTSLLNLVELFICFAEITTFDTTAPKLFRSALMCALTFHVYSTTNLNLSTCEITQINKAD